MLAMPTRSFEPLYQPSLRSHLRTSHELFSSQGPITDKCSAKPFRYKIDLILFVVIPEDNIWVIGIALHMQLRMTDPGTHMPSTYKSPNPHSGLSHVLTVASRPSE
jgi:hypothetical protein